MDIAGKVLVVTGAGSGIGRQVALQAIRRGGRVAAVDIHESTLDETATDDGRRCCVDPCAEYRRPGGR